LYKVRAVKLTQKSRNYRPDFYSVRLKYSSTSANIIAYKTGKLTR